MKTGRPRFRLAIESDRLTEVETLYRKTKDVRVKERAQTILFLDTVIREVGTATCGPDVLEPYQVRPGVYPMNLSFSIPMRY
jgi:hypothetical protein